MILALVDPLWTRLIQFFRTSYLELLTVLAWAALVWGLVLLLTHGIRALVRRAAAELEPSYNALRHLVRAFPVAAGVAAGVGVHRTAPVGSEPH
jgi:hypothetical protein